MSQLIPCRFAIDGWFYSWLDIPVLGFGPGEERFTYLPGSRQVADFLDVVKNKPGSPAGSAVSSRRIHRKRL